MSTPIRRYDVGKRYGEMTGEINISGIDYGHVFIVQETKDFILARVAGRMWRQSLGNQAYAPPEFIIFEKADFNSVINPLPEQDFRVEYDRNSRGLALHNMKFLLDELQRKKYL